MAETAHAWLSPGGPPARWINQPRSSSVPETADGMTFGLFQVCSAAGTAAPRLGGRNDGVAGGGVSRSAGSTVAITPSGSSMACSLPVITPPSHGPSRSCTSLLICKRPRADVGLGIQPGDIAGIVGESLDPDLANSPVVHLLQR